MADRVFKEEKKTGNRRLEGQSILTPVPRSQTIASSSNNSNLGKPSKRNHGHNNSSTAESNSNKARKQKR
jgi:hypothetical protein